MTPTELARWQWQDYDRYHRDRGNLLLHLVAVPLFWLGLGLLVAAAAHRPGWPWAAAGAVAMGLSLALQGRGHRREALPPVPFSSPANAVARLLVEQLVTYPRFVLSGGAFAALRAAR